MLIATHVLLLAFAPPLLGVTPHARPVVRVGCAPVVALSADGNFAALRQKVIDSGKAATQEEAQKVIGRKGLDTAVQRMVDSGEAATAEEAHQAMGRKGLAKTLQGIIDRGEAVTPAEAQLVLSAQGYRASLQTFVDSGEAATLEEAKRAHSSRALNAKWQKAIDSGEAATMEEAKLLSAQKARRAFDDKYSLEERRELGRQAQLSMLQKMVDRGEAATIEAAQKALARRAHDVAAANHPLGATGLSLSSGVASALAAGRYVRYPGVRWRKDSKKWRVQFSVPGPTGSKRLSLGSFATEEEAARVHDDYVRKHGLSRPLHFPREGEPSSAVYGQSGGASEAQR